MKSNNRLLEKRGVRVSGVIGEGFVEEIKLAMCFGGIYSTRIRERIANKDEALHRRHLLYSLYYGIH